MSDADVPPSLSDAAGETFCAYFARQLVASRGFSVGTVPEADPISAQSDVVLTFNDAHSFVIVGLIDHEAHPQKVFTLTSEEIEAIGGACRKHAGGLFPRIRVHLMQVGSHDPEQARIAPIKRNSVRSDVVAYTWLVDTATGSVWTTAPADDNGLRSLIHDLFRSRREPVVAAPETAVASPGAIAAPEVTVAPRVFPWLTAAILIALIGVFAAEIAFAIGGWDRLLEPSTITLRAFGGLGEFVLEHGQWYRIFAAPFLHADASHLAMNVASIALAGFFLEHLVGRAWFGAIYAVGAVCGSLLSLALNPGDLDCVGASGAGMALFAVMLVLSGHFPAGEIRRRLRTEAAYVLVPSLLPLAPVLHGVRIDYAAHFGGAIGGAAVALVILVLWRPTEPRPRLPGAACAVAIVGCAGVVYAAVPAATNYLSYELGTALAPPTQFTDLDTITLERATALAKYFPRDPRMQFLRALRLWKFGDLAEAESELRAALAEEAVWTRVLSQDLSYRIRAVLALVLTALERSEEAKEIAQLACANSTEKIRDLLDRENLCAD